jgi:hypothetical protein
VNARFQAKSALFFSKQTNTACPAPAFVQARNRSDGRTRTTGSTSMSGTCLPADRQYVDQWHLPVDGAAWWHRLSPRGAKLSHGPARRRMENQDETVNEPPYRRCIPFIVEQLLVIRNAGERSGESLHAQLLPCTASNNFGGTAYIYILRCYCSSA